MDKPSKDRDACYRWKKACGNSELSPLRLRVHRLIASSPAKTWPLGQIYRQLTPPADSPAKMTSVRMALSDLIAKDLIASVAVPRTSDSGRPFALASTWACSSLDPGYNARQQKMIEFLQENSEANDPAGATDVWCSLDAIRAAIGTGPPKSRDRIDIDALGPDCVKSNGLQGDLALYAPVKA